MTVTDQDGASVGISGTATVADAALSGSVMYLGATQGVVVNGAPVATFTDSFVYGSASDYTATINWGDGTTTAGVVEGSDGAYGVRGSHTYAQPGFFTLTVTLSDAGGSATATGTAGVAATPVYTVGNLYASGGSSSDYAATIDWGDGTDSTDGAIVNNGYGSFAITGSHAYAEEGNYNVTVTVTQVGGATATLFSTATVVATALTAAAPPQAAAPLQLGIVQLEQFGGDGQELVANDQTGATYDPEWKGGILAGDVATQLKQQAPLAFVSGTSMVLDNVEFFFPGFPTPAIEAVGTVTGPGIPKGMTFTVPLDLTLLGVYTLAGNPVAAQQAHSTQSPKAAMEIHWQVHFQNGLILDAGTAANRFYVPYAPPSVSSAGPKPLYETVLKTGCKYNGGNADTQASVIQNAWAVFHSLNVPQAVTDVPLTYYGTYTTVNDQTETLGIAATACASRGRSSSSTCWRHRASTRRTGTSRSTRNRIPRTRPNG